MASATLLRPFKSGRSKKKDDRKGISETMSTYDKHMNVKERLKTLLESEELVPRVSLCFESYLYVCSFGFQELFLMARMMRIAQVGYSPLI